MQRLINNIHNGLSFSGIFKIPFYKPNNESYEYLHESTPFFSITSLLIFILFNIINTLSFLNYEKAFLFLLIYVITTRTFHIDGLVDVADAFFGAYNKEKRLEILKDSRIGVFGASTLFLYLAARYILYLKTINSNKIYILLIAMTLARHFFLFIAINATYPRNKGLGKIFIEKISFKEIAISFIIVTIILYTYINEKISIYTIIYLYLLSLCFSFVLKIFFYKKIEGVTGDCLGASIELLDLFNMFLLLYIY